jgi:hypothetical protein
MSGFLLSSDDAFNFISDKYTVLLQEDKCVALEILEDRGNSSQISQRCEPNDKVALYK